MLYYSIRSHSFQLFGAISFFFAISFAHWRGKRGAPAHLLFLLHLGNFLCGCETLGIECGGLVVVMPLQTQMQSIDPVCWQSLTSSKNLFLSLLSSCSRTWSPWPFMSLGFLFRIVPLLLHRVVVTHNCVPSIDRAESRYSLSCALWCVLLLSHKYSSAYVQL